MQKCHTLEIRCVVVILLVVVILPPSGILTHFIFLTCSLVPTISALKENKPVYLCRFSDHFQTIIIDNCEVLLDSENTAVDLVLSYHDAQKLNLTPTDMYKKGFGGGKSRIVQMFPPVKVTFSLGDVNGNVTEKKAFVDVWVRIDEIETSTSTATVEESKDENSNPVSTPAPINQPSPIKHSSRGANLGLTALRKLGLKIDFRKEELFILEDDDEIPGLSD